MTREVITLNVGQAGVQLGQNGMIYIYIYCLYNIIIHAIYNIVPDITNIQYGSNTVPSIILIQQEQKQGAIHLLKIIN